MVIVQQPDIPRQPQNTPQDTPKHSQTLPRHTHSPPHILTLFTRLI